MASNPSPRRPTPSPNEDGEKPLRSERSSITINCSDGSMVIFVRPNRPRSSSYTAGSPSPSPRPPPGSGSGSGQGPRPEPPRGPETPPAAPSGPGPGNSEGSDPGGKKKGKRPVSMPTQPNVYDNDIHTGRSHMSLPAYLSTRCAECGHRRGHSEICSIGYRTFIERLRSSQADPNNPLPPRVDEEGRENGIEQQQTQRDGIRTRTPQPPLQQADCHRPAAGNTPRPPSSVYVETGRGTPQPDHNSTPSASSRSHSQRAPSRSNRTPSPLHGVQHGHRTPPQQIPSRNNNNSSPHQGTQHGGGTPPPPPPHQIPPRKNPSPHPSDNDSLSSQARYSIEAVVGQRRSSSQSRHPSSRSRHRHRHHNQNSYHFSVRELPSSSPVRHFNANIRGGGDYQGPCCMSSSQDGDYSGTGRRRRKRGRDILLRGLRRCFAFLFGESDSSYRDAYDYSRYERPRCRCCAPRTRRH